MSTIKLPPLPTLAGDDAANYFCHVVSVEEAQAYATAYAEEAVRQALAAQAKSLRDFADRKYCAAIEYARRDEALGWESKAKSGRFGADEYACHKKMNEAFGAHFGIYEALKQIVLIPEKDHGEST